MDLFTDQPALNIIEDQLFVKSTEDARLLKGWLPSLATQKFFPENNEKEFSPITLPGLSRSEFKSTNYDGCSGHLEKLMINLKFSPNEISTLRTKNMSPYEVNLAGLEYLIKNGSYYSACDLTHKLLTEVGNGVGQMGQNSARLTEYSAHLWLIRFNMLIRLSHFKIAEKEMDAFNNMDAPDIYLQFEPENKLKGSIIPFGLRILHAILPYYLDKKRESIERIYYLLSVVNSILYNVSQGLEEDGSNKVHDEKKVSKMLIIWKMRKIQLLQTSIWIHFNNGDHESAISLSLKCLNIYRELNMNREAIQIVSGIAKIYLTLGNISQADKYFDKALKMEKSPSSAEFRMNELFYKSLIDFAKGDMQSSKENSFKALSLDPGNLRLVQHYSVILFYCGNIKEAIYTLEKFVENKAELITDKIVSDLCALYELESESSIERKKNLLKKLVPVCADRISAFSFKIKIHEN